MILDQTSKTFPKFNIIGRSMLIKFKTLGEEQEPWLYLHYSINKLPVDEVADRDIWG